MRDLFGLILVVEMRADPFQDPMNPKGYKGPIKHHPEGVWNANTFVRKGFGFRGLGGLHVGYRVEPVKALRASGTQFRGSEFKGLGV